MIFQGLRRETRFLCYRLLCTRHALEKRGELGSRHSFQHRLDSAEVLLHRRHCVAAQHAKESPQFFPSRTVSEHVTRIDHSVHALHYVVFYFSIRLAAHNV